MPVSLPPGSLLILNDRIPIHRHDPQRIAEQLKIATAENHCCGILLDLQRPDCAEATELIQYLISVLPCPVCVSDLYAADLDCPVFLPPCPHHLHLDKYLEPWQTREIWLDLAHDAETITVTGHGSTIIPAPLGVLPEGGHTDAELHCHYSAKLSADSLHFTLWRTTEDLHFLREEARSLGIRCTVMLLSDTF